MVEKYVSCFFLLLTIVYLYSAQSLSFGTVTYPKSGFMPTIIGGVAFILSLVDFIMTLKKKKEKVQPDFGIKKVVFFIMGILAYIFALDILGYTVATILVMLFLLKVTGTKGWVIPTVISICTGIGFFVIFEKLLQVSLP